MAAALAAPRTPRSPLPGGLPRTATRGRFTLPLSTPGLPRCVPVCCWLSGGVAVTAESANPPSAESADPLGPPDPPRPLPAPLSSSSSRGGKASTAARLMVRRATESPPLPPPSCLTGPTSLRLRLLLPPSSPELLLLLLGSGISFPGTTADADSPAAPEAPVSVTAGVTADAPAGDAITDGVTARAPAASSERAEGTTMAGRARRD